MKEIIIASSVILGVAAISTAAYFIIQHLAKSNVKDGDGMVNDRCLMCTYSSTGGMDGNSLSISIKEESSDTALLEVHTGDINGKEDSDSYTVSTDTLKKIYDLCDKYDVTKWGELPESEIKALDAPIVSITIETTLTTVRFNSNKKLPEKAVSIISEIDSIFDECIKQAKSSEQPETAE